MRDEEAIQHDEEAIQEEMQIALERLGGNRRALDKLLCKHAIRELAPELAPACIPVGSFVSQAVASMAEEKLGHVLITRKGILAGILTDRDVVRKIAAPGLDPAATLVENVMTPDPETLGLDVPIAYALNMMGVGEYRHVPLVDDKGRPEGSLSVRYILRHFAEVFDEEARAMCEEGGSASAKPADGGRRAIDSCLYEEPIEGLSPRRPSVCLTEDSNVRQVIDLMVAERVGHVIITRNGRVAGIITERDIVRKVVAPGVVPETISTPEIMTRNPVCLQLGDPVACALNQMGLGQFRHIPLVDDDHKPVGSLSVRYILRHFADLFKQEILNLPPSPGKNIPTAREGA
jgi:CBS domain-containing protein